jgi:serine/threonine protein kinase/Flp pilus assembly protein TadD
MMVQKDADAPRTQDLLEKCVERFERSWTPQSLFESGEWLEFVPGAQRLEVLAELVRVDMELQFVSGSPRDLDTYLARFPELLDYPNLLAAVAFEDYRLRFHHARKSRRTPETPLPEPGDYAVRYGIHTQDWPGLTEGNEPDQSPSRASRSSWLENPLAPMPKTGQSFCGFHLIGLLGTGACGKVFLARQGELANRLVCLKVTMQSSDESIYLARLQHSHIVPVYSIHKEAGCNAICMPFLGLATLKDVLVDVWRDPKEEWTSHRLTWQALLSTVNQHRIDAVLETIPNDREKTGFRQLSHMPREFETASEFAGKTWPDVATRLAEKMADGLAHAHGKGIVHGDIKPGNILITDDGEPVLLDFHLSQSTIDTFSNNQWVGGTLPYMAPELMESFRNGSTLSDRRSDIWSLGVVLFELYSGRHPWKPPAPSTVSTDLPEMIRQRHQAGSWRFSEVRGRKINPDMLNIIRKCLAPDPDDRYQDAGQLHDDLYLHVNQRSPVHAPSSGVSERIRKFSRRHPRLTSATSIGLASALIIATLTWTLMMRSARLAGADAMAESREFVNKSLTDQLSLSVMSGEASRFHKASADARQSLELWNALTADQLFNSTRYSRLPAGQQSVERNAASDLHFWLAESFRQLASHTTEPNGRRQLIKRAEEENQLARSFFAGHQPTRSIELQKALIHRDAGQIDEFQRQVTDALEVKPDSARDRLMTAWLSSWLSDQQPPPVELAREAIRDAPLNYVAWITAGNLFLENERPDEAVSCYEVATSMVPAEPLAHYFLGRAELDRQNYAAALLAFDRVLQLSPDDWSSILNEGLCKAALGQWQDAEEAYSKAIRLGANATRIWYLRANARRQLGDNEGAAEDFKKFLEMEPDDEISFVTRGTVLVASDPDKAVSDFRSALMINPRSRQALQNLAHVYSEIRHDLPAAIGAMDQLIGYYPKDATQIATRGVLHARGGSREAGLADAELALQIRHDADTRYRVAGIYAQTSKTAPGDAPIAIQLAAQALFENPGQILGYMAADPDIEPVKSSPQWQELEETAKNLAKTVRSSTNRAAAGAPPRIP